MSDWQRTLDVKDVWQKAKKREVSAKDVVGVMIKRLRALPEFGIAEIDATKEDVVDAFLELREHGEEVTFDDIDVVMEVLYSWADTKMGGKFPNVATVCWIKTF